MKDELPRDIVFITFRVVIWDVLQRCTSREALCAVFVSRLNRLPFRPPLLAGCD
jgi:hypothetical protein